ncbi:acyl carrier protein [Pantoea agglomerans]|uniref:acyl carrier protein n=1 Tax=Enterobacter agglomerans TaxID=549 RepID=UPI0013B87795|nr:phosphopantetheine-binding protein [Pantoea agglomerans]NEG59844.1 acyl carrier protein [Pantoea agglomerans]NEG98813.1 acyl carrier protein [Pantoea agglomerans]NEH05203.1 acyl carrier protein [Pantoea agglomerans]NEH16192.1 acyl carrier protein [Pantoea agglomerans]
MMEHTVEENLLTISNIIWQVSNIPSEEITADSRLIPDLKMDSVELIDLLIRLEGIGIVIPESDINSTFSVQDIMQYI